MSPNAEIEQVPLDSLLAGSEKTIWEISPHSDGSAFPIWIIIGATLLASILFSRKLFPFLSAATSHILHPLKNDSRHRSYGTTLILLTACLFCCCLISGTLCYVKHFPRSEFLHLLLILVEIIAAKIILLVTIGAVSESSVFINFIRASILLVSAISSLALILDSIIFMFPSASGSNTLFFLISIPAICMILFYLFKVSVTLFSAKISPFYSFLYLCTLEVIPFCIIAVVLARL